METLLDFCFLDHAPETEQIRARLLKEVTQLLMDHPLKAAFEHHRSRLLARARDVQYLHHQRAFGYAVIDVQARFVHESDRSDAETAAQLDLHRRFTLYSTAGVSEYALLGYLVKDSAMPLENIDRIWFQAYRDLLRVHARGHAERALLLAFRNLAGWLEKLPSDLESRCALAEASQRAAKGVPWEDLPRSLYLHLCAHAELRSGAEQPDDLLVLLRTRYTNQDSETVLEAGLQMLRRLPGLRARIKELCEWLGGEGWRTLGNKAWFAALQLVGSLVTGLPELELTGEERLTPEQQRRLRRRQQILADDAQLRRLLYDISHRDGYAPEARKEAWRVLLQSVPQERMNYYTEAMKAVETELFDVTLDMAGRTFQRGVTEAIMRLWPKLTAGDANTPGRKERLELVCEVIEDLRHYDFLERRDLAISPLLTLALDDPDSAVRERAIATVHRAGYTAELERELQRRELERLRETLTVTENTIVDLEKRLHELGSQVTLAQGERTDLSLQLQEQTQQREFVVTEGWIATADIQVQLQEVQIELNEAIASAEYYQGLLHGLAEQMTVELAACQRAYDHTAALVREEERCEARIRRIESELHAAEAGLDRAQSRLQSLSPPDPPRANSDDTEEEQRAEQEYEAAVREYEYEVERLEGECYRYQREIESCTSQIREEEEELARLADEIDEVRREYDTLRARLMDLEGEFRGIQATCEEIRFRIEQLAQEVRNLRAQLDRTIQAQQNRLATVKQTIRNIGGQLDSLSARLEALARNINSTADQLQQRRTEAQQLIQDIESGRQHYDALGDQAEEESAQANAAGVADQQRFEAFTWENQDSLLWYAMDIDRAVRYQPTIARPETTRRKSQRMR
jgi:predicted  nucleic acid-binding Zn-ribbon protein